MDKEHLPSRLVAPPATEVVLARFPNLPEDIAQVLRDILTINEKTLAQARELFETGEERLVEEAMALASFRVDDRKQDVDIIDNVITLTTERITRSRFGRPHKTRFQELTLTKGEGPEAQSNFDVYQRARYNPILAGPMDIELKAQNLSLTEPIPAATILRKSTSALTIKDVKGGISSEIRRGLLSAETITVPSFEGFTPAQLLLQFKRLIERATEERKQQRKLTYSTNKL